MNFSLIEVAYNIAKKEYNNHQFAFKDLFSAVTHSMRWSKKEADEYIGELYTDMMQDKRFVFCGHNNWCLSEFLSLEQKHEFTNKLYESSTDQVYEEDYQQQTAHTNTEINPVTEEVENENIEEFVETDDEVDESYQDYESMLKNQNSDDDDYDEENNVFINE